MFLGQHSAWRHGLKFESVLHSDRQYCQGVEEQIINPTYVLFVIMYVSIVNVGEMKRVLFHFFIIFK